MASSVVLDTSVVVAWFFTDEPLREKALAVRAHVADHPADYVVPHLFTSELIHVLARKSGGDERLVRSAVSLIIRLGIRTISLTEDAYAHSAAWACRGLSGYDATFVGLAQDLGGRWLTADDRALASVGKRWGRPLRTWTAREKP